MTNEEHDRVHKDLQRAANDFAEYGYEYQGADELEIAARAFAGEEYERGHAFCGLFWSIRCWLERGYAIEATMASEWGFRGALDSCNAPDREVELNTHFEALHKRARV